jgi:hypothetical protein
MTSRCGCTVAPCVRGGSRGASPSAVHLLETFGSADCHAGIHRSCHTPPRIGEPSPPVRRGAAQVAPPRRDASRVSRCLREAVTRQKKGADSFTSALLDKDHTGRETPAGVGRRYGWRAARVRHGSGLPASAPMAPTLLVFGRHHLLVLSVWSSGNEGISPARKGCEEGADGPIRCLRSWRGRNYHSS